MEWLYHILKMTPPVFLIKIKALSLKKYAIIHWKFKLIVSCLCYNWFVGFGGRYPYGNRYIIYNIVLGKNIILLFIKWTYNRDSIFFFTLLWNLTNYFLKNFCVFWTKRKHWLSEVKKWFPSQNNHIGFIKQKKWWSK